MEEIIAKLRAVEMLTDPGDDDPDGGQEGWDHRPDLLPTANMPRALKEDELNRLQLLEQANSRLKRIVAEKALDIYAEGCTTGKILSPARRRDAVVY